MKSIIELARRAGIAKHGLGYTCWEGQLERFAALVRNETLEEAAVVCIETGSTKGNCDAAFGIADACAAAIRAMKENGND